MVKEALLNLAKASPEKYAAIRQAFDREEEFRVQLPDGKYLGVHIANPAVGKIIYQQGCWMILEVTDV